MNSEPTVENSRLKVPKVEIDHISIVEKEIRSESKAYSQYSKKKRDLKKINGSGLLGRAFMDENGSNDSLLKSGFVADNYDQIADFDERSSGYNLGIAVLVASGGAFFGYNLGIWNPIGTKLLKYQYGLTGEDNNQAIGNVNLLFAIGACIGCLSAGFAANAIGRFRSQWVNEIQAILCYAGLQVPNLYFLYFMRVLGGIVAGIASSVGPIATTEILPKKKAGMAGVMFYSFLTFFLLAAAAEGLIWHKEDMTVNDVMNENWRLFQAWPIVISIVRLVLFLTVYRLETPQYYINKYTPEKSVDSCHKILAKIYVEEDVIKIHKFLITEYEAQQQVSQPSFMAMFQSGYRKRFMAGLALNIFQQLSGINFFILYSVKIFDSIGSNGNLVNILMSITNFGSSFVAMYFITNYGRKTNILYGLYGQGVCMWGMAMMKYTEWYGLMYPACMIYMFCFSIGMGGSSFTFTSEVLPPIGMGMAMFSQWVFTGLIGKYTPDLADKWLGVMPMMVIFTAICVVGFFIIDYLVIETKGKADKDISHDYLYLEYKFLR